MQKVDLAAAVHLAANELQLGDLPLGLAVGPRLDDGCPHGILVVPDPEAKEANSLPCASRSQEERSSVFFAATMVLKRSWRLRAATIPGEVVSTATLTRKASADLQSRSDVSSLAMVRAGGTSVTGAGRSADGCAARRLRVAHSLTTRWLPLKALQRLQEMGLYGEVGSDKRLVA